VPIAFGLTVYGALDRVAPAPFVEAALADWALRQGDGKRALGYALRLPASPVRDELLARAAASRCDDTLALEYFLAAPDVSAVQAAAEQRARRDPADAFALEGMLATRLEMLGTHPDAVAEARWSMGIFANERAWREVPGSPAQQRWLRTGLRGFIAASDAAPFSGRYALAAANQAILLGDVSLGRRLFARAAAADPGSADAIAGLGVGAYHSGDRGAAQRALERSRRIDPGALMVRALERLLAPSPHQR
jgi:hypothetical protein